MAILSQLPLLISPTPPFCRQTRLGRSVDALCQVLITIFYSATSAEETIRWHIIHNLLSFNLPATNWLFLLVRFPEDVDDDGATFHPEYSHQLFGDE